MKNEEDMHFLQESLWFVHIVGVTLCDWNVWIQDSCLIHLNEKKIQLCVIYLMFKFDFYNKINIYLFVIYF